MRWHAALAVLALVLAGCNDGPKGGDDPDADFTELGLEATDTTGVIRGVVVDATIKPIVGALITLSGQAKNTTTQDDGLFGFEGIEPGDYFLEVKRAGYVAQQQSVTVVAGEKEPPIVKFQLVADGSIIDPYFEQYAYTGYISCSFKAANYVFDAFYCDPTGAAGIQGNDDANPFFDLPREPTLLQIEITWESTQPLGDELVTIQYGCADAGDCGDDDYRLCNVRGPSPLVCRINGTIVNDGVNTGGGHPLNESMKDNRTGFSVGVYANCDPCYRHTGAPDPVGIGIMGVGLVYQQQFQIYAHAFYGYEPPADWLFTTTNSIPPPP